MSTHYSSFLLRCWHGCGDEQRIKIEHIQSGERAQVTTLAAALVWIDAPCELTSGACPTSLERVHPTGDEVTEEGGEAEFGCTDPA